MIDRERRTTKLAVKRQAELLGIPRQSVYYKPRAQENAPGPVGGPGIDGRRQEGVTGPKQKEDREIIKRIDELHLAHPAMGVGMLCAALAKDAKRPIHVGRKRMRRLMLQACIEAICPKPGTSRKTPGARIMPYLLNGINVVRANQVWVADITYIRTEKGVCYLFSIMDLFSRRVMGWRETNTLSRAPVVECVSEAVARWGAPEILNTDQGSQFTSEEFKYCLKEHCIRQSMDGKNAWRDNVFMERLWRSLKIEEVYLKQYSTLPEARDGIRAWIDWYNRERPHSSLPGGDPPNVVYFGTSGNVSAA